MKKTKQTMGSSFHELQLHHFTFLIIILFASTLPISAKIPPNSTISKPNCNDTCGDIPIPYPFGTTQDCYENDSFFITCNLTFAPPKPFMQNTSIEITDISLDGQLKVLQFIAYDCYINQTRVDYNNVPLIELPTFLTVNNTANKFTVVGCDTLAFIEGERLDRNYLTACMAICFEEDDLINGSCTSLGCSQNSIPEDVRSVELSLYSNNNYSEVSDFNRCGYAFLVEESAFNFSSGSLTSLRDVEKLPMVVDWAIGNGTCEEARMNSSSYACVSANSECYKPNNGYGYRCSCSGGYRGNPYLIDGCQDIDECNNPLLNKCGEKNCHNTIGSFKCHCPKGYHDDKTIAGEQRCIPDESLVFKLVAGIALGVIVLLLAACWLHLEFKRRKLIKMRRKFFFQNGGQLLQQELFRRKREGREIIHQDDMFEIYTMSELQKATNNFHKDMIVGQGGYGTVYKGFLPGNKLVAIKKSKEIHPNEIEQFVNEVIVLSQIKHKNVVKLRGCCLETKTPSLVYEFISNGTLYKHIHNKAKSRSLTWDVRLRIATEVAGVLAHLHSSISTPIIHRDVKSANILLDHTFEAKVSDFGASRLVPSNEAQLYTRVQGTFGYLDPEYMQTTQLTEKSDVYSFGVVLVELLTGMKALKYDGPEEDRSLANFFLSVMKKERLFQVVEENVVSEENKEELIKVAFLARSCLNVKGDDRPTMKEVAMELEGLRRGQKHSWVDNGEETESLLSTIFSGFVGEGNSMNIEFDSLKDQIEVSEDGGR